MLSRFAARIGRLAPGIGLCLTVTLVAVATEAIEQRLTGRAWLESLVLAILIGTLARTLWAPGTRFESGIAFSAKTFLEIAVALLGLSVSGAALVGAGPALVAGIAALVALAIALSYGIGRGFGLPSKMAMLIACGNSICGNSAIAATAPVIDADGADVAASIAFTAVLGVAVVLALPPLGAALGFSALQYGVFAGLTVYAVPQVLAATAPVAAASIQIGTLVKLVRVLMLGPVILALSLRAKGGSRPALHRLVPWFIVAFLALAALRSGGYVPSAVLAPAATVANGLTIVSMAALGLYVDVRVVAKAGPRVASVVVLSLVALGLVSYGLIRLLKIA